MKNREAQKYIRRYYFHGGLFVVLLYAAVIALWRYTKSLPVFYISAILFLITEKIGIRIIAKKCLHSALMNDLDPQLYLDVLTGSRFLSPSFYYIILAYFELGYYETVINICAKKLEEPNPRVKNSRYAFNLLLAKTYYILGDNDRLSECIKSFETFLSTERFPERIRKALPVFEFYGCYLNGDIEGCKKYFEKYKNAKSTNALSVAHLNFSLALALYRLGEKEKSAEYFAAVKSAPKLDIARLSDEYLTALNGGEEPKMPQISPDPNYVLPDFSTEKRRHIMKSVLIGALILLLVGIMIAKIGAANYNSKLEKALTENYFGYDDYESFSIKSNSKVYSSFKVPLYAVALPDGKISVCMVVSNIDSKSFEVLEVISALETGETKFFGVSKENPGRYIADMEDLGNFDIEEGSGIDGFIECTLYNNKADIPKGNYETVKIKNGSKEVFLCVEYIDNQISG